MTDLVTSNTPPLPVPGLEKGPAPQVPTDEMPIIRLGLTLILIAFGGLLAWSVFAPLAKGIVAPGTLVVDSNRKSIQHLEGGIVSEILVRDGDAVKAGQVLMRLDEVSSQAQRDVLYGQFLSAKAKEARLLAERDESKRINWSDELMKGADENGRKLSIRNNEQQLFESRRLTLAGQLSIYEQRVKQLDEQIKGFEAQVLANTEQIRLIDDELDGLKQLYDKGYASKTRLLQLQRNRAELDGERGNYEGEIARARMQIGEARLQILQVRKAFEEDVADKLREAQQQIFDLEDRLTNADDVLQRREVKAPGDGIIVGLRVHTLGGVVRGGETIMELVPNNERLIVEAMVSPNDIDNVAVGQEAEVRFSALSSRQIPILLGTVIQVDADVTTDQRGNRYYLSRVEVPEDQLSKLGGQKIVPGMPTEVLVRAGERTLVEYLMKPLTDSFFRAFKEV
ncbi:HlyD family type I secretion periplasmic adaptor subunit [Niveispirillum sp. SYP-B3756]|uniref:HlyD family type I secretion periplasmic adaptor subunit n=1 Tax=Niveispirillum sp. SYP-B3756 TaxID=2662178 RepID=UPI0012916D08|nr:HlyD family type I secretion periplasmic adaptor subunit [Niveispirillum sp. SYP-B3756]MQP64532.1 HlyD family type I secretion periplasmic adaptor subunit [Niveispirillum sp. SYP-B3756]